MTCLKQCLNRYFGKNCPDFVGRYGENWKWYLHKWCEGMNIVPVFDTAKRDRDGIAIYWKNCKSNRSTHAVLVKKGKNIFNPGNVKIERLRSFIYFVTMFPPKL